MFYTPSSIYLFFFLFSLFLSLSLSSKLSLPSRDELSKEQIQKLASIHEYRNALSTTDLNCTYIKICGFNVCSFVCEIGSLYIPPWLRQAMFSQIHLQDDVPLNWRQVLGTHNTYNALPYGVGLPQDYLDALMKSINPEWKVIIANQEVSITDQLNIGIRFLELDVHWLLEELRLCHAGGVDLDKFNELIEYLENVTGEEIYFDSETLGCWNFSRQFRDALVEINDWLQLPENQNEFLFFYTDTQQDLLDWGKATLVVGNYTEVFGDTIFTQSEWYELYPDQSWPTTKELLAMGKRVMICGRDYGNQDPDNVTFIDNQVWAECAQADSVGYPDCIQSNYPPGPNSGFMTLVRDDALYYGPFWNGSSGGDLNETTLPPIAQCSWTFTNPDELDTDTASLTIWSWDVDQPAQFVDNVKYCTKLRGSGSSIGRWATGLCSDRHLFACVKEGGDPYDHSVQWTLSSVKSEWTTSHQICPDGFTFEYPRNGRTNQNIVNLLATVGSTDDVWLNVPFVPSP